MSKRVKKISNETLCSVRINLNQFFQLEDENQSFLQKRLKSIVIRAGLLLSPLLFIKNDKTTYFTLQKISTLYLFSAIVKACSNNSSRLKDSIGKVSDELVIYAFTLSMARLFTSSISKTELVPSSYSLLVSGSLAISSFLYLYESKLNGNGTNTTNNDRVVHCI